VIVQIYIIGPYPDPPSMACRARGVGVVFAGKIGAPVGPTDPERLLHFRFL
jgi:hypothetical protein